MKSILRIHIESGRETCASEPGVYCHLLRTSHFGQRFQCELFGPLKDEGGWLQRDSRCIEVAISEPEKQGGGE